MSCHTHWNMELGKELSASSALNIEPTNRDGTEETLGCAVGCVAPCLLLLQPIGGPRRALAGRFNPLKVLQPKRRLQQILASSPVPVPKPASGSGTAEPAATAPVAVPVPAPPAFDYCRFIELDYVPMETGYMVSMRPTKGYASTKSPTKGYASTKSPDRHSRSTNSPSTPRSRRTPAAPSNRDPYDNHGIRPPPPEQYLTPLQQKEVCIRHLRARLKETINTLQDRDTEIDELRGQLYRMQEDWVEEECHRVEAQLALKEARQEIQQLKHAVETVRNRLSDAGGLSGDAGVQKYFQDINIQNHKLENLLLSMELAQAGLAKEGVAIPGCRTRVGGSAPASVSGESPGGVPRLAVGGRGSCSCDGSPARSLTRSSTYTKLSDQALADQSANGQDFPVCQVTAPRTAALCAAGRAVCPAGLTSCWRPPSSLRKLRLYSTPTRRPSLTLCPPLCLTPSPTPYLTPSLTVCPTLCPTLCHTPPPMRSCAQACSPTSTWLSDEGEEELDSITTTTSVTNATVMSTATEPIPVCKAPLALPLPRSATVACSMESPLCGQQKGVEEEEKQEKEKREKETTADQKQDETTAVQQEDGGQQSQMDSAGGNVVEGQDALDEAPETEASPGMQRELKFVGCCGEGRQSGTALSVEEDGTLAGSTQAETDNTSGNNPGLSPGVKQPHTSQPRRSTSCEMTAGVAVGEVHEEDDDEGESAAAGATEGEDESDSGTIQKSYWSRHFLVDLLAVAIPVVPTVAWLCRGPIRGGQPMYHIGSLLRGCCTVALHSLRRGGGLRHYPAGGGDMGGSQI
ncbi:hypothetical protein Q5P01_007272 [Channa striata]|uniref:Syntaphilin n=1 Tax=Channa striata TaxID=64152 RepID=A0AA88NBN9_CHASR|nr:hypothetical protein Q5P01_007272 [Channa striata]